MAQQVNVEKEEKEEKKELIPIEEVSIIKNQQVAFDPDQKFYGGGGWLPPKEVMVEWRAKILKQAIEASKSKDAKLKPSVQALSDLINSNDIINELTNSMIEYAQREQHLTYKNITEMLWSINIITSFGPQFVGKHLIGVPLAALFTGVNATLPGQALFRITIWNQHIGAILREWGEFLYTPRSFPAKDNTWLLANNVSKWAPKPIGMGLWIRPSEEPPYWSSWNDFFARNINRKYRPMPIDIDEIITSPNDGGLFRIRKNIKKTDTFWLKGMPYSLTDILGPTLSPKYADRFVKGSIFQTFLDPFNYHRWWSPVSGSVIVADVLPGLYYSKLVVPDYGGATTGSCPYLTEVNARGIVIIDTADTVGIGYVCCIPIGMVEVSSIIYPDDITKELADNGTAKITKGQELGHFAFGGSSFAIIFEGDLETKYGKSIVFKDSALQPWPTDGTVSPDGSPSNVIHVGMQIAIITPSSI